MSKFIKTLDEIMSTGLKHGLIQQFTEDEVLTGRTFHVQGEELLNFGSCSYLGLEYHPALKAGAADALQRFGTQFSSSRAYMSVGLYRELEERLEALFGQPAMVTASTTLGHLATLPIIVGDDDAVIIDLQVHSSVQMTAQMLKARKIPLHVIKHNCMESLENKIKHLRGKHRKIWYLADGVYSMYGDYAPLAKLEQLMDQYPALHLYVDDAHGMGWAGENGVGYVRSQIAHHSRMVMATSLNKSFASGGGVILFPNREMMQLVRNCGSTMIFSGPVQPPMLGAALASAKLHADGELTEKQEGLRNLVAYTNRRLAELSLPQYCETDSPLFFIPAGLTRISQQVIQRMKASGFYLNAAAFPAVPMKQSGIRFMMNCHLTEADVEAMLTKLQEHYVIALTEHGSSCAEVAKVFRIPAFEIQGPEEVEMKENSGLTLTIKPSVLEIDGQQWDRLFRGKGNMTSHNLNLLEKLFKHQKEPENNWKFYYASVHDQEGKLVLCTYYTCALVKDDMFADAELSERIEQDRLAEPYLLTARYVLTGSPITKGEHLYLDQAHPEWKKALALLIDQMQVTADEEQATKLMLRDFVKADSVELKDVMYDLGLVEYDLPNNCVIDDLDWTDTRDFLQRLGGKYRYNVRKEIIAFEDRFEVSFEKPATEAEIRQSYELYEQVFARAFALNVFKLPYPYFQEMCRDEQYDVIRLSLKGEETEEPVAVMFSHHNAQMYNAMIVGLDYEYVRTHNVYKQILFRTVLRAQQLDCLTLDMAYTAELEKKKLGARTVPTCAFVRAMDHYQDAVLMAMA